MESVPRVNSSLLARYPDKTVRLVGRVIGSEGSQVILEASDKGQVVVSLAPVG
jgi:hypothetical protein